MINSAIISLMGTSYDADAQLYFNQLSVQPSAAFKSAINTLVLTLKADGNWTTLDRLWIHAAEVQQHATISLVNPTSTAITEVNSPTWTANQGYTGNGSTQYLNTNFNTSSSGVNYTQNSNCIGIYSRNNTSEAKVDIGNQNATVISYVISRWTDNNQYHRANVTSGGFASAANTDSRGLFTSLRTNSTTIYGYKNGSQACTTTNTSGTLPNLNLFIGALNNNGTPDFYSTKQYALSFISSGAINQATFYTAIQTFATTRGFNV